MVTGLRLVRVRGDSMAPWLPAGSWRMAALGAFERRPPRRGDVALVRLGRGEALMVKRIVGLPGELLEMRGKALFSNAAPLGSAYSGGGEGERHSWRLGPTEYAVLGDNRAASQDSRHWGKVERHHLAGRVFGAGRRLRERDAC